MFQKLSQSQRCSVTKVKFEDIRVGAIKFPEVKLEEKCRKTEKHFLIKL